ncbi:hypothetical protein [Hyphomonas sp.]|uniref:hypothetical protein n=1 Tax=Hyphomonas sp. TaxID=87 RepID=UPI0030FB7101
MKDQNWFAVALDFLIVVIGVFIGVQIGNWNQSSQERRLFDESFARAIVEIQTNLSVIEDERATISARLPVVQQAIEDLRACRTDADAKSHIEAAFAPLGVLSGYNLDTKALDQLINNDNFLPYQTPDMRKRLMALSTRLNTLHENSKRMGDRTEGLAKDFSHIVQPGPLSFEGPEQVLDAIRGGANSSPEMVRKKELIVPLDVACKDEAFLDGFYVWEDRAYYHWMFGSFVAEALRSNLEALGVPADEPEETAP